MAEMTVAEAVEFCSGWKDEELPFITGETLTQIAALLEQQAAEIEQLKCCGNCEHSAMNFSGGSKMLCKMRIMGAMDNYAKEKCEKWQGVK